MENVNPLGECLKELRAGRPLNQIEKESGINRGQLRRYEAGRIPEDELLVKLADYYRVPYQKLKGLAFEMLYPAGSRQQEALFIWVQQKMANR